MIDRDQIKRELSERPGMDPAALDGLITDAIADFLEYTHRTEQEVGDEAASCIKDLAAYRFNTRGVEGLISEGLSGVSSAYDGDIPKRIRRKLNAFRRLNYPVGGK